MGETSGFAKLIIFLIIAFIVVVIGAFLFPSLFTQVTGIDTTGFGSIHTGVHTLIPFAFIGAIIVGIIYLFKRG